MFCFDHLGAEELNSGYIDGNVKSAGVSRKVGYDDNGSRRLPNDEGYRLERLVWLTPDALVRPAEPLEVEGLPAFRRFIGLDRPADGARQDGETSMRVIGATTVWPASSMRASASRTA